MEAQALDDSSNPQSPFKRRLGRGLTALLGSSSDEAGESRNYSGPPTIPITAAPPSSDDVAMELIERNPYQPRRDFDQAAIDELADSIRRHGILQPLLVRQRPNGETGYQLVAGERRWRAAQQVGLETIPCRVLDFQDQQVAEAALEENLKRQDLNALEKAQAFRDYLERFGGTIEELGRQLSLNRATVSNMMRLLELPADVQALVRQEKISAGHAKAILPLSESQQLELARQIEADQLSVRRTEEIVREILKSGTAALPTAQPDQPAVKPGLSTHVLSLQEHLRQHLGAKVDIRVKKNESGQIVISFTNNDDFERIVGQLRKAG